jgi:hypothetical protein
MVVGKNSTCQHTHTCDLFAGSGKEKRGLTAAAALVAVVVCAEDHVDTVLLQHVLESLAQLQRNRLVKSE